MLGYTACDDMLEILIVVFITNDCIKSLSAENSRISIYDEVIVFTLSLLLFQSNHILTVYLV